MIQVDVVTLFVVALVAGIGAYFGTYLREKAKNRAMHEDINRVVRATEDIKAQISGDVWLKQRRWEIKWQCYSTIVEHLGEMASLLEELITIERQGTATGLNEEALAKRTAQNEAALMIAVEKHRRYASMARIVVAPEVRTLLTTFADEFNATKTMAQQAAAAHKAWGQVLDVARADLLGEPRETATTISESAKEDGR